MELPVLSIFRVNTGNQNDYDICNWVIFAIIEK